MNMALDTGSLHELWRMQLLDELRARRAALDYEPQLDPEGRRRSALADLIAHFEDVELAALQELAGDDETPPAGPAPLRKGGVMRPSILVAYASKKGSTAEVATFVGNRLRERGLAVDVREAAEVEDITFYDGVVLGGSLYFGRWHSDATSFLKRFQERPLAVFALGPKTASEHDRAEAGAQLERALGDAEPATVAVFGGVIDPEKLRFPFNRLPASDARDWTAIGAWVDEVAALVARQEVTV
jgi:menaquinone-dependent protoporphyrinogen oxidase